MRFEVFAQGCVDPRLVFASLSLEPRQQVGISAQRDLLFDWAMKATLNGAREVNDLGVVLETTRISRETGFVRRNRSVLLRVRCAVHHRSNRPPEFHAVAARPTEHPC